VACVVAHSKKSRGKMRVQCLLLDWRKKLHSNWLNRECNPVDVIPGLTQPPCLRFAFCRRHGAMMVSNAIETELNECDAAKALNRVNSDSLIKVFC
jgi:hypothetical protein